MCKQFADFAIDMTHFDSFYLGCRWGNCKLWLQIGKRSSCYLWIKRHCKLSGLTNKSNGLSISLPFAVVWQSKIFKPNSCDPVKAMNQARKRLWPIFGRISTLRSVFKMVQLVHTETFPWVSHLYYVLRQPPSHNLLENPGKSLKRERLHKKLNDYKLDFEVMKQENSHFTFFLNLTIFKIEKMEYLLLNIMNKLLVHNNWLFKTDWNLIAVS